MKVIIQIPCFNEAETLPVVLNELPREIQGIDEVEWLVVDDGSEDKTADIARRHGVNHVVRHPQNLGLARAFATGLEACLERGADIVVNTDADNQYSAADIPKLLQPILDGEADMVIGSRPIDKIQHFSPVKKRLQYLGSWIVRKVSQTDVIDAPSGFRAFTRDTAAQLNVFNSYTYTLETIIQAGQKGIKVVSVPISVNKDLRPSRLVKSIFSYVERSVFTILRIFMTYRPMKFFFLLGSVPLFFGVLLGLRFLVYYGMGQGGGKVQSLIFASLMISTGFLLFVMGLLSDLIATNRQLLEKIDWRLHRLEDRLPEKKPFKPR